MRLHTIKNSRQRWTLMKERIFANHSTRVDSKQTQNNFFQLGILKRGSNVMPYFGRQYCIETDFAKINDSKLS